jgi:hypothetical protein
MLNATSPSSQIAVMGKTKHSDCLSVVHLLSSRDSDGTSSAPHKVNPAKERAKSHVDIQYLSSVTKHHTCVATSTSAKLVSDNDTALPILHDSVLKDDLATGPITTGMDVAPKESVAALSHRPSLDGDSDVELETTIPTSIDRCHSDESDNEQGSSVATAKPMDAISPRFALMAFSVDSNNSLPCNDDSDDSEVFADVIYAPECHRDSRKGRPRSIRFSDEKEGTTLATIHLIPWTDDDDANWLPRLEKCRMEL